MLTVLICLLLFRPQNRPPPRRPAQQPQPQQQVFRQPAPQQETFRRPQSQPQTRPQEPQTITLSGDGFEGL